MDDLVYGQLPPGLLSPRIIALEENYPLDNCPSPENWPLDDCARITAPRIIVPRTVAPKVIAPEQFPLDNFPGGKLRFG